MHLQYIIQAGLLLLPLPIGISRLYQATNSCLQLVQNTVAWLFKSKKQDYNPAHPPPPIFGILKLAPCIFKDTLQNPSNSLQISSWSSFTYISELLTPYFTTRLLRSFHCDMLAVLRQWRKKAKDRAFSVEDPQLWKHLPEAIRQLLFFQSAKGRNSPQHDAVLLLFI